MNDFSKEQIIKQTKQILTQIWQKADLLANDIFVVGLSTSEVLGSVIGQNPSLAIGRIIITEIYHWTRSYDLKLAVQGCEHLNRALVLEESVAKANNFEIVDVLPSLAAGGSGQIAAFELLQNPVEVEFIKAKAGLDIGDTAIGMHIKHVQVPIPLDLRKIGSAHVSALTSRPKKIGGSRAKYGKWSGI